MVNSSIENYVRLEKKQEEIAHLDNLLKILKWDFTTYIPKLSAVSRQKEIATLVATIHRINENQILITLREPSNSLILITAFLNLF